MHTTLPPPKTDKKIKKGAGGKLQRSEVVQTRMSPRLRYLAEIMARHQRRSLSGLIENLIESAAEKYILSVAVAEVPKIEEDLFVERKYQKMSLQTAATQLWSALAFFLPDLLTHEEERLWSAIKKTRYFWLHFEVRLVTKEGQFVNTAMRPIYDFRGVSHINLKEYWPKLDAFLQGHVTLESVINPLRDALPCMPIEKPDYYPYPDEEIVVNDGSYDDEY
jgi:hypothetical protein